MKRVCAFTAVLMLLACSPAPAQQTGSSQDATGGTAARVGDRTISLKEIDARWQADNPAQQAEATQALYQGRRAALDAIIADMLVDSAAKANGVTAAVYATDEIARRLKPVTDVEVKTFYEGNKNQMQGRAFEEMSPLIRDFLKNQHEAAARQALIADLRAAGPAVRMMFEPPRTPIAIDASDPSEGNSAAPVTIVEFSDFQCPFCQRALPTLKQVKAKYGDKVRIVWKDFPLTQIHPQAFKAAEAARCAAEQGKFWAYHDRLFGNQQALLPDSLKQYAADLGMDAPKFNTCLDSAKYETHVRDALAVGARLGISSTPTLYVNGRIVQGAQPYETFAAIIDEELASK